MFFKLLKYEWRAMIRAMLPIYVATLAIAAVNGLMINGSMFNRFENLFAGTFFESLLAIFQALMIMVYVGLIIGLFVMTMVVIVQRFYKGLLKEEGYLMFTLPVSVTKLTLSKAVISMFISIITGIVAFFAIGLLAGTDFFRGLLSLPGDMFMAFQMALAAGGEEAVLAVHCIFYVIEVIIMLILGGFESTYGFYAAMSLGQMARTHRVIWAVVWYIGLSIAESIGVWSLMFLLSRPLSVIFSVATFGNAILSLHLFFIGMIFLTFICLAVRFVITDMVLKKKLNLE